MGANYTALEPWGQFAAPGTGRQCAVDTRLSRLNGISRTGTHFPVTAFLEDFGHNFQPANQTEPARSALLRRRKSRAVASTLDRAFGGASGSCRVIG